jgi:hypothetical protein
MEKLVFLVLALSTTANAQTYKCVVNNNTSYQAQPCNGGIEIKSIDSSSEKKVVISKEELATKSMIEESNARLDKLQSIADEKIRRLQRNYIIQSQTK